MNWLDTQEIRAHVGPTLMVVSPLLVAAVVVAQTTERGPEVMTSPLGVLGAGIGLYVISQGVRQFGERVEPCPSPEGEDDWDGCKQPLLHALLPDHELLDADVRRTIVNGLGDLFNTDSGVREPDRLNSVLPALEMYVEERLSDAGWRKARADYRFAQNVYAMIPPFCVASIIAFLVLSVLFIAQIQEPVDGGMEVRVVGSLVGVTLLGVVAAVARHELAPWVRGRAVEDARAFWSAVFVALVASEDLQAASGGSTTESAPVPRPPGRGADGRSRRPQVEG